MDLTYPEVGATRLGGALPTGYRHVYRGATLGRGEVVFAAGRDALRDWRMFRAAGLAVRADALAAAEGVQITNGLGIGPIRLWVPCRIVWVVDEPGRYGFGMGTRRGHPESGEEAFEVMTGDDGRVRFGVRAFSRPASWYARLGGPVTRTIQDWVTGRYLSALLRLVGSG